MRKYELSDFTIDIDKNSGDCYIEADFDFNPNTTFELDDEGYLYFDDTPRWESDYFYFENGEWVYVGGENSYV